MILLLFYFHIAIFIAGIIFAFLSDILTNPDNIWFYWAIIPWGLILAQHGLVTYQITRVIQDKFVGKWYNLLYPVMVCGAIFLIVLIREANLLWMLIPAGIILCAGLIGLIKQPKANSLVFSPLVGLHLPEDLRYKIYKFQKMRKLAADYPSIRRQVWKNLEEEEFYVDTDAIKEEIHDDMHDFRKDMKEFREDMKQLKRDLSKDIQAEIMEEIHIDLTENLDTTKQKQELEFKREGKTSTKKRKFCVGCGAPTESGFIYCQFCGQKIR